MIPRNLFLYWGGGPMSFLRYLTVYSFCKVNPEWNVAVYYPSSSSSKVTWYTGEQGNAYNGKDYFPLIELLGVKTVPLDMHEFGESNLLPEVHKSGIFRAWATSTFGGIYADCDILFFKPLIIPEGIELVYSLHPVDDYFSDGFIGCSPRNNIMQSVFDLTTACKNTEYQGRGINIWDTRMRNAVRRANAWNIPTSLIYHYDCNNVTKIVSPDGVLEFPEESIGIHWFGGNPLTRVLEDTITPEKCDGTDIISQLVRTIYKEGTTCQ